MTDSSNKRSLMQSLQEYRAIHAKLLEYHADHLRGYEEELALVRRSHARVAEPGDSASERLWERFRWKRRLQRHFEVACALLCIAVLWRAFACW